MKPRVKKKPAVKIKERPIKKDRFSLNMELFCHYYMFGGVYSGDDEKEKHPFRLGHGVYSYATAYGLDAKKDYKSIAVMASNQLNKISIKLRCKELLDENGLNDSVVDARLLEIIKDGADSDSNRAIKEYNTLKKRVENNTNIVVIDGEKKKKLNKALEYLKK